MLIRISILDTPERNESITTEQVNFSQSNQIADTQPDTADPTATTENTITDLIQLHVNQALLLNQEQMIQEQPQIQHETVITTAETTITNLNQEQKIQEQPQIQHESTENPITAAEKTITNLIQLHVNQAQISNQEQTRVQNDLVNLVQIQIQPEQSNKSKIQINRNFVEKSDYYEQFKYSRFKFKLQFWIKRI